MMDKTYSPQQIEETWYARWESQQYFAPQGAGASYCIMLPPPNITGYLHMGHGFQQTLMDVMIRYHRMQGMKTLWQPGTDHAGIATQLVVERQLESEGLLRNDLSRSDFVDRIWQWKETYGNQIARQMRRLGSSVDWSRERFTMDPGLSSAVHKVFIQLYDEGLIYRGTRLVNWDPKLGTAISDLEVTMTEEPGNLWHIRYPLVDSDASLIIATTRPETLLGDVAIAVNPDDPRYHAFIGKEVELPLCGRTLPVIADSYVDPTFGSGCVKITPAHDFNDYEIGKRHGLASINILNKNGSLNKNVPPAYQGMERFVARDQILSDLEEGGFLVKTEPHSLKIPRSEKSGVVVEPFLTEQWYVDIKPLAAPAIDVVRKGEIEFLPKHWTKIYFQWMENIEDWCISRQLWWGHRIPAWYDDEGKYYVGYSENDVRFKYQLSEETRLKQDEDVLDTWFSSALWPFSTLGWPEKTADFKQFYPTSLLVTGFDIIFFWVARMIMMGLKFTGKVPFKKVLITGLIRDSEGQKMSKTKGNVLDPLDIIDGIDLKDLIAKRTAHLLIPSVRNQITKATRKEFPHGIEAFGTDALRLAYCLLASTGRSIRFDMHRVESCRNFCNKLWNASRFVLLNTAEENTDFEDGAFQYSAPDQWILSRLQNVIALCHQYIASYRFDLLASTVYEFVWHEYCDWYLELSKSVLYNETALGAMKRGTRHTLIHVLDQILKLLHPMMPFITEEIWQRTSKLTSTNTPTIMLTAYPSVDETFINSTVESEMEWLKEVIQTVRTLRSEMQISPAVLIPLYLKNFNPGIEAAIDKYRDILMALCKLNRIRYLDTNEVGQAVASAVVGELELLIPLEGLINPVAELERLAKEIAKLDKDIVFAETKLSNVEFTAKAPQEVILKTEETLAKAQLAKNKLLKYQTMLQNI